MKNHQWIVMGAISLMATALAGALRPVGYPQAEISNGQITAKVFIPDPDKGYYRGTRFDWSGVISSLRYRGHEYFGPWRDIADNSEDHDNIMGPVESFMANDRVLGYNEAKVGETFLRIGVGLCEKPEEDGYTWSRTYKVVDSGKWTIKQERNWIEFRHQLSDGKGYAYIYTKRLTLTEDKPELVLSHRLVNTGEREIATQVFNHNFFVIDGRPSGPEFEIQFPFPLTATRADLKGRIVIEGNVIRYPQEMEDGMAGMIGTGLEGFGPLAEDNTFQIRNKKTGAGVRVSTDQPLVKLHFWTVRSTVCPEPYIYMEIKPGEAHRWDSRYLFFEAPPESIL